MPPIDPPIGYTTYLGLKKYADGDNPGADALNEDKDTIDSAIWNVSQSANITATAPISVNSPNIIGLNYTNKLVLSGAYLDLPQSISTSSTPTFAGITINGSGSFENVSINKNASITGNLVVGGIITAEEFHTEFVSSSIIFKSGSTIFGNSSDDRHLFTGSLEAKGSGSFTGTVTLGVQASSVSQSVRADRYISASSPLTGGGNLTADRTLALSYNSTNLKLTSNALNTIQDIATSSSPQFINLTLKGNISSSSGFGNNYLIGNTTIGSATAPVEKLQLHGNLKQTGSVSIYNDFISGWAGTGFRLDKGISDTGSTKLEIDNLTVRGTLSVYELLIQQLRATNGSVIISSCARVSSSIAVSGGETEDAPTEYILFEDITGHGVVPFLVNDIIMCQQANITYGHTSEVSGSLIKRIVRKVEGIQGLLVTASLLTDAPSDTGGIEKGDDFVRIGNTTNANRQGVIYLTADDTNNPYIDIINGVSNWTTWTSKSKLKTRLGNLSGITDGTFGSLSDYGLYGKNVILSSDAGTGIALKVDTGSAVLTMKQSGNTIFDFNTSSSVARIAGWTINQDKIYKNNGYYITEMSSTGSYPYFYAGYGLGAGVDDNGVWLGRIPYGLGIPYSGSIGILSRDNYAGKTYFVLASDEFGSYNKISNWTFDENKLYNGTDVVLDATNKKISVYNDKVKMFYTSTASYGISGSGFELGSTNEIADWNFDTNKIYKSGSFYFGGNSSDYLGTYSLPNTIVLGRYNSTSDRFIMRGSDINTYVQMGIISQYPFFQIVSASNILISFTSTENKVGGWHLTADKLYSGSTSKAISLNTTATPYISSTGKGIEFYDVNNPKMFIGDKTGSYIDWNITSASQFTISGSTILGSRFSTKEKFSANGGIDIEGFTFTAYNTNYSSDFVQCIINPSVIVFNSGSTSNAIRLQGNSVIPYIEICGFNVPKHRGHTSIAPTTYLKEGDTYSSGSGAGLKVRMYVSGTWVLLN